MKIFIRQIYIVTLFICVISAPLNTLTTDEGSPNIQKIPSATNGQLSRPSPINPNIPSEPKPEEHITYITPSPSVGVNEDSSGSDDILHPPALNAYEKVSSSDSLHKLNKRDTSSEKSSITPTPVSGAKLPIPITLGQPTIAQPLPSYKYEKRSANDEAVSSQFETSHHIPAHIQQVSKHDIGNPTAASVSKSTHVNGDTTLIDKKQKRELPKDTKSSTATSAIISEAIGTSHDEIKKTKLPISFVNPALAVTDKHYQNKRQDVDVVSSSTSAAVAVDKSELARVSLISTKKQEHPETAANESQMSKNRVEEDKPVVENDDHEPVYVHPVPVSQIIKNSQAAPEIHS